MKSVAVSSRLETFWQVESGFKHLSSHWSIIKFAATRVIACDSIQLYYAEELLIANKTADG